MNAIIIMLVSSQELHNSFLARGERRRLSWEKLFETSIKASDFTPIKGAFAQPAAQFQNNFESAR